MVALLVILTIVLALAVDSWVLARERRTAAVPAQVMADVEALARRIEADYDARRAQAGTGGALNSAGHTGGYGRGTGGGASGSRLAVIG